MSKQNDSLLKIPDVSKQHTEPIQRIPLKNQHPLDQSEILEAVPGEASEQASLSIRIEGQKKRIGGGVKLTTPSNNTHNIDAFMIAESGENEQRTEEMAPSSGRYQSNLKQNSLSLREMSLNADRSKAPGSKLEKFQKGVGAKDVIKFKVPVAMEEEVTHESKEKKKGV